MASQYGPDIGNALMGAAQIRGAQQREQINALAMQDAMAQRQSRNAFAAAAPNIINPATRQNALMALGAQAPDALPDAVSVIAKLDAMDDASRKAAMEKVGIVAQHAGALAAIPDDRLLELGPVMLQNAKRQYGLEMPLLDQAFASGDPKRARELINYAVETGRTIAERQTQSNADRTFKAGRDDAEARQAEAKATREATEANRAALLKQGDVRNTIAQTRADAEKEKAAAATKVVKLTEDQAKSGGFADRATEGDTILNDPKIIEAGMSVGNKVAANAPLVGNFMVSSQYQQYDQAARNFINATLRRDSGAAISDSEWDNARKQYLPQPGDGQDVLRQKAQNRKTVIGSLARSAGPGYQPQTAPAGSGSVDDLVNKWLR